MRTIFTIIVLVLSIQLKIIECKICPSTDIRSQISNLSKLEGCKIIFGYLKIVLIDVNATVSDYDKYVFPELVEITEYLLMYNVHNLTSIAKLFPNLRVIRGKQLIRDYSLIIFDLPHIQEVSISNFYLFTFQSFFKNQYCSINVLRQMQQVLYIYNKQVRLLRSPFKS